MEFWNSLLTEKSWQVLQELKKRHLDFILIGGWATYILTKQHKSKDIDIIIKNFSDLESIGKTYDLRKNDNLKKYEIKVDDIDIDIYIANYSKLALQVNVLLENTTFIEGFEVVKPEILLILKQGAELDRKNSVKGLKDRIDIMTLLCYTKIDFKVYVDIIERNNLLSYKKRLIEIIKSFDDVKHLNINLNEYSKLKKNILKNI